MKNYTWICPRCSTINWDTRDKCQICGQKRYYTKEDPIGKTISVEKKQTPIITNGIFRTIIVPSYYKAFIFDLTKRETKRFSQLFISKDEVICYDSNMKTILSFSISKNDSIEYTANKFVISVQNNEYTVTIKSALSNEENINIDDFAKEVLSRFYGYITIKNENLLLNQAKNESESDSKSYVGVGVFLFFLQFIVFMFSIISANVSTSTVGYINWLHVRDEVTTVTASSFTWVFVLIMVACCIGEIALAVNSSKNPQKNDAPLFVIFAGLTVIGVVYILIGVTNW